MHEKANQGLTLSIILFIPQPSKLPVGKLVSCTKGVVISSNVPVLMPEEITMFYTCSFKFSLRKQPYLLPPFCLGLFVPRGEERGEMVVCTGFLKLQLITQDNARKLVS